MKQSFFWLLALLLAPAGARSQERGQVTMPLEAWRQMLQAIEQTETPRPPPVEICPLSRSISGSFRKGLFTAELDSNFEVLRADGHVEVPILDGGASIEQVLLDGRPTSLIRRGGMYHLGIEQAGSHRVRVKFFWGQEQDRFSRRLRFRLPADGNCRVEVVVPEQKITASLAHGVLTTQQDTAGGTRLTGYLEPSGLFDLSWKRLLTHREGQSLRLQVHQNTLYTAGEVVVSGVASFEVTLLEGETDRLDFRLDPAIEVLRVQGDAVLQWRTDSAEKGGQLTVLLRHLVQERVGLTVHFQFPARQGQPVELRMPLPPEKAVLSGAVGILGPAGLNVKVAAVSDATQLTLRDLPPDLTELASSPLLYGFSFKQPPRISLTVKRHREIELTSTLVDEIQASSVLIEDGTEITKIKLRMRNNTRQYLSLRLPAGAVLTHSLIDGQPVRPAYRRNGEGGEQLLFPLRQSERIGAGAARHHTVQAGETLSGIANFYYSDPSQWRTIFNNNRDQLANETDLMVGQTLRIPAKSGVALEESSFVIELAYQRRHRPLGGLGRISLELPSLDTDSMKAIWHLYFPRALEPLSFSTAMTQLTAVRYDPFRRLRSFLRRALFEHSAWAGVRYESILKQRKAIYHFEVKKRAGGELILAAFPLVGDRYRFRQVLPGRQTPAISVIYVTRWAARATRWLVFAMALSLGLWLLARRRSPAAWIAAALGLSLALILGHYFLGSYRRLVWGIDLALLISLWRLRIVPAWKGFRQLLWEPWTIDRLLTFGNLAFLVGLCLLLWLVTMYPLLLSSLAGVYMIILWWRGQRRQARQGEVAHV